MVFASSSNDGAVLSWLAIYCLSFRLKLRKYALGCSCSGSSFVFKLFVSPYSCFFSSSYYHHNLPTISAFVFLLFFSCIVYHKIFKCELFKQWKKKNRISFYYESGLMEFMKVFEHFSNQREEKKMSTTSYQPYHGIASKLPSFRFE